MQVDLTKNNNFSALNNSIATVCTCTEKVYTIWVSFLRCLLDAFTFCRLRYPGLVFVTLLSEPFCAIKSGLYGLYNSNDFTYHGMNPSEITEQQANKTPILLLHGNHHDQTAWLHLAGAMRSENLGPVYTVNLNSGEPGNTEDAAIINNKILEIQAQFKAHNKVNVQVDIVGHSRGADFAYTTAFPSGSGGDKNPNIRKMIHLGSAIHENQQVSVDHQRLIYEIDALYDCIVTRTSKLLYKNQKMVVSTAHLGLIYDSRVHKQVIEWLR